MKTLAVLVLALGWLLASPRVDATLTCASVQKTKDYLCDESYHSASTYDWSAPADFGFIHPGSGPGQPWTAVFTCYPPAVIFANGVASQPSVSDNVSVRYPYATYNAFGRVYVPVTDNAQVTCAGTDQPQSFEFHIIAFISDVPSWFYGTYGFEMTRCDWAVAYATYDCW